ncbi:glutathione S-transferase family protein [Ruegeria sp. WL0004]|uniref:Glutathione S-transferase family protein n=1 Tax=Ruegeria marisflavi TaxID=2984152 RepID=A0ABT2WTQ1_9RHOB|nr:glutathione S-transferase family protein [Ruegeria sp. WL0004]MCU9839285.1 glutathione S-transferase family protein [Ruegeria sp. WL0004]
MRILGQKNSINVRKVLWTCAEAGLSVDREDWGGQTWPTSDPSFLVLNPKGLVPVLLDGDLVLTESNTICRYVASRQRRGDLLPEEPAGRASVEAWMDWQIAELNTAWRAAFMGLVRKDPRFADQDAQKASVRDWNAAMTLLDRRLSETGAFVCGKNFTLADIVLALSTNRWESTPMERPDLPAVADWMGRMSDRGGFHSYCRNGQA